MVSETEIFSEIKTIFTQKKVVLFCGAGISLDHQAGLPDWLLLRDMTLNAISSVGDNLQKYKDILINYEPASKSGTKGVTPELVASAVYDLSKQYFDSINKWD